MKRLRILRRSLVPITVPANTPRATGAAMNGLMSPRAKYVPALAAAVTPIMKLLVVVDALSGARIKRSMAITLNRPLPMPSILTSAPHPTSRQVPAESA